MKKAVRVSIICLVTLAIVATAATYFALDPFVFRFLWFGENFDISQKGENEPLTVMSFNVRYDASGDRYERSWHYRADLIVKTIAKEKPDIIGFQEAQQTHTDYFRNHLRGYAFKEAYRENAAEKEGALIAYRRDAFQLMGSGMFWLSESPDVQSKSWGSENYRVASYVTLKDKSDKTFTAMDTHLDHVSSLARFKGMDVILNQINALKLPTPILMGDMNDTEHSAMYLAAIGGLLDAQKAAKTTYLGPGATYHAFGEALDNPRIDFFFVDPSVEVENYRVVDVTYDGVYPSDHFPIAMDIQLG